MLAQVVVGRFFPGLLLMSAAVVLYVASRATIAVIARPDGSTPGLQALGQWLPIAATAVVASFMHHADIAISVIFGASVALSSLVLGMAIYLAPIQSLPASRRVWPFVLPAALLPLLAGFSGHLTWIHAVMLLILGAAVLPLWRESPEPAPASGSSLGAGTTGWVIGAIVISLIGAVVIVMGTMAASRSPHIMSPSAIAATLLSPLLVLPSLGTASAASERGHSGQAIGALVATVLLNLCLLLPIVIFISYAGGWFDITWSGTLRSTALKFGHDAARPAPYPMATWRVETVMLLVVGFILLPVSMGKWLLGRVEAGLLIAGYVAYLILLAVYGLRTA